MLITIKFDEVLSKSSQVDIIPWCILAYCGNATLTNIRFMYIKKSTSCYKSKKVYHLMTLEALVINEHRIQRMNIEVASMS